MKIEAGCWRLNPVLIVLLLLFFVYWIIAIFVICVDPLWLYPWGMRPEVSSAVSPQQKPELIGAETLNPATDLIVVGSSISAFYSKSELRRWISGTAHPVNLSYFLPGYEDNKAVLSLVTKSPNVRRVLLFYHHATYLQHPGDTRFGMPMYALDQNPLNDLRAVNFETFKLALSSILRRPLYEGASYYADIAKAQDEKYAAFQTPEKMKALATIVNAERQNLVTQRAGGMCSSYPGLTDQLEPFAREMSQRGVEVYIIMPLLSHAYYAEWLHTFKQDNRFASFFARDLEFRQCLVTRLSRLPRIKILAFEDRWIVDDLANFEDPGHLHSDKVSEYFLSHLNDNNHLLTIENVDSYISKLRFDVTHYHVQNYKMPFSDTEEK